VISLSANTAQILLVVLFALSLGFVAYPGYAAARGWARGTWASNQLGWISTAAFIGIIASLALTIWQLGWVALLITVIGGGLLAFLLVSILKSYFQWIGFLMPVLVPLAIGFIRVE
jgi:hypothetical protein